MQADRVYFTQAHDGYDKAQVDSYIRMITQEYRALQQEFEKVRWIIDDKGME